MSTEALMTTNHRPGELVPVDPANSPERQAREREEKTRNYPPLLQFLNQLCDAIKETDRAARFEIMRTQVKSHKYFDGRQFGYVNDHGEFIEYRRQPGDVWYVDNVYLYYIQTAAMEMDRAMPQVEVSAAFDDPELKEAAKLAQARIDSNRKKLITEKLWQEENMRLLLDAVAFRYTYFSYEGARQEKLPVFQDEEIGGESLNVCANCSHPVNRESGVESLESESQSAIGNRQSDVFSCPSCGYNRTKEFSRPKTKVQVISGYEKLSEGMNKTVSPNPLGVNVYLGATTIRETPWVQWTQLVFRAVLEEKHKDKSIPSTGTKSLELRYARAMGTDAPHASTGGLMETGLGDMHVTGEQGLELIEHEQTWVDYPFYCQYRSPQDERLPNGKVLPAGMRLGEMYPDGLYIERVSNQVLDLWNEDKNDKWTAAPYGLRPGSFYGAGTSSAHSDQDRINDLVALKMANAFYNGTLRKFVNADYLEGSDLSSDPTEVTKVTNLGQGERIIGNVYDQAPPVGLPSDIYKIEDDAKGSMQSKIGAFSTNTDAADMKNAMHTATGLSIVRDMAVGRFGPALKLRGYSLDVEQSIQFIKNELRFFTPKQWKRVAGEYGMRGLNALLKCNIDEDLLFTLVENSYMPETTAQKRANRQAFLESRQLVKNEEEEADLADTFGIPLNIGGWTAEQREASVRLEKISAICNLISQSGIESSGNPDDPMSLELAEFVISQANVPIDMLLDNHQAFIDFYKDWRVADKGQEAAGLLKVSVHLLVKKHYEAQANQLTFMNMLQTQTAAPELAGTLIAKGANAELDAELNQEPAAPSPEETLATDEAKEEEKHQRQLEMEEKRQELKERDREHESQITKENPE